MNDANLDRLLSKKCAPCEGGMPPLSREQAESLLKALPDWKIGMEGKSIKRDWKMRNFVAGIDFFERVAALAEEEGHHPDLHLVGYRNVTIELWTHAIGGLSENDFIVAAKIDRLPAEVKA